MRERIVSKASRKKLAKLLSMSEFTCERLADILGTSFNEKGSAEEALQTCIDQAAKRGKFNEKVLDAIEAALEGAFGGSLSEIAVAMGFKQSEGLLPSEDVLRELKSLAVKGRLHEGSRFVRIKNELDSELRDNASTSIDDREQLLAWFDAADRQVLDEWDMAWMIGLVELAAKECGDEPTKSTLQALHNYLSRNAPPWRELKALDQLSQEPAAPAVLKDAPERAHERAPEPPPEPAPEVVFEDKGPPKEGIALAIGISNYPSADNASEARRALGFTSLKCAALDAEAVANVLREQQDIDFKGRVYCLVDKDATLRGIMDGLDKLREDCRRSAPDPLVVVYFSGHGMPDSAGRHYLVPHDGNPDALFSTALWNKTFSAALEQIPTKRLVVLLDACHAQAMAPQRAKSGPLLYDPGDSSDGLRLAGRGRYFIASCETGQRSFEGDGNGVFTQELLALLQFKDLMQEQLDLGDLYRELRERVPTAASSMGSQTPTANFSVGAETGVIVAINRRREAKLRRFYDAVLNYMNKKKPRPPVYALMELRLGDYVTNNAQPEDLAEYEKVYSLFAFAASRWAGPHDERRIAELCRDVERQLGAREQTSATIDKKPEDRLSGASHGFQIGAAPKASELSEQPAQEPSTVDSALGLRMRPRV